jgi:hypothetical protein
MKRLLALAAALLLASPAAAREAYALLIGASTYESLDPKYWLKGPANDVALVREYLRTNPAMAFPEDHITVLADAVEGAAPPTLAAIRAAFADLAAQVQPGDFVYLHFSGHGTQAPAADPSAELDGLDELFLPVDIGPWEDTTGHVENGLVDDEIGAMIDAIRAKGADVWAVFDSCHSGTVTRAVPSGDEDLALRQLPAEALGIPEDALEEAGAQSRALPDPRQRPEAPVVAEAADGMGGFVAFFAAQTNETTPEKNMPKGKEGRKPQGVFTYTLFETLAEFPGITYRQLGQEVLRRYAVKNLTRTTPMFEGDLDVVVFGGAATGRVAQWPAEVKDGTVTLAAGRLHGLSEGTRLAVMASPAEPTEAALGFVTVTSVDTFGTVAAPEGTLTADAIPGGAWLRKVSESVDFTLTVALPAPGTAPANAMIAAAAALSDNGEAGRLRFVGPGQEADLHMAVFPDSPRPDAIWFLPASGLVDEAALATTPSVSTADKSVEQLAEVAGDNLRRIGRALNLLRIGATSDPAALAVGAELRKARLDPETVEVIDGTRGPLDTANVPRLIPDDVIGLRLTNDTAGPVDFNILYVGADYSVEFMFNGRLQPGDVLDDDYVWVQDTAFGRDRLVLVLSPAEAGTAVEDLSFLAQDAVETTRGGPTTDLAALLGEAGFGETTRGAVSLSRKKKEKAEAAAGPVILQYEIDTVPAP